MFIKMHSEPFERGLLAQIGSDGWHTLTALAFYMDKNGECYPTQDELGERLGVSRVTVNKRISAICKLEYNCKPVLTKRQVRFKGGYANNVYTINTEIFSVF